MQLHLHADELNLLADTLIARAGVMSDRKLSAADIQAQTDMGQAKRRYEDLVEKVLARDLRLDSDELEQVADLLGEEKRDLNNEIAGLQNSVMRFRLQQKLGLVERILERVEEACAML